MDELLLNDPDYQQKQKIVEVLKKMEKIQRAKNERWKVRAYNEAWRAVEGHILPINSAADAKKIQGIGSGIATKIGIIIETGTHPMLDEYDTNVKAVEELSQVHGIGSVFANSLIKQGITTLAQLRTAVDNKTVEITDAMTIGLKYCEDFQKKIPYDEIKQIETKIRKACPKRTFIICGSHRRKRPTSGDIDILLGGSRNHLKNFVKILTQKGVITDDLALGEKKYMGVCKLTPTSVARRLDILYRPAECYWTAVSYFTGSKEHNVRMRNEAIKLGYTLNEDGLYVDKGRKKGKITKGDRIPVNSEEHLFEILGMDYLKPEEREADPKQVDINIKNRDLHHPPDDDDSDEDESGGNTSKNKNIGSKAKDKSKGKGKSQTKDNKSKDKSKSSSNKSQTKDNKSKDKSTSKSKDNSQFKSIPVSEREQLYDVNVGVLLAYDYMDKETDKNLVDPTGWYLSEKYDGVRAVWDGKTLRSRNGKEWITPADFTKDFPNIPLDGELYIKPNYFNETSGLVRRKAATDLEAWKEVVFMVFDTPIMSKTFEERQEILKGLDLHHPIKLVTHEVVKSADYLQQTVRYLINAGSEGGIIREPKSYYVPARSPTILKVKDSHCEEAVVVGWKEGKGRNIGRLGALSVRWADPEALQQKYKLNTLPFWEFEVGSGLSDSQRPSTLRGVDGFIPTETVYPNGTIITIKFPELQKSGKPRHPSFQGVRAD